MYTSFIHATAEPSMNYLDLLCSSCSRIGSFLGKRQILVKLPRSVKPESCKAGAGAIPALLTIQPEGSANGRKLS